jgi:acyl-CoA thioester hydrolase
MARIKIELPASFSFTALIPVRITDVNYGGHVGNDTILTLVHEARMQFLKAIGFTELEFAGVGLIMSDAAIEFKAESFYGDILEVSVTAAGFSRVGFDLYYKIEKPGPVIVATAKTGMICYDYDRKKVVGLPAIAKTKLEQSSIS